MPTSMPETCKILSNTQIAQDIWKLELETAIASDVQAGQFVMVAVPGFYLRRPISICDAKENQLTLIYKVLGAGTKAMTQFGPGQFFEVEGPLGQGCPLPEGDEILLLGGGVGTPPMVLTAKQMLAAGKKVQVCLGFNTAAEVFGLDLFEQLGVPAYVATMDGSAGTKGTVLDAIARHSILTDTVFACGPLPMLKAVQKAYSKGWISLEERMGCGYGVCMGCVVPAAEGGSLRVCKDGPVFPLGKVVL